ncbi:hypothetical protein N665_0454s0001 [Sinapis alba]|nr:hypothetical protein N665_0454s0001 [Sinapis alba]
MILKVEFLPHHVDPDEADAYLLATCDLKAPPLEPWCPVRRRTRGTAGWPSRSSYSFLIIVRRFCRVPDAVEFRKSRDGERADTYPDGYVTCYKAHLLHCRLWLPIPEVIVQTLDHFGLSISQISLYGLQHLIGILVLSYKQSMTLDTDYFEALLAPKGGKKSLVYCLKPLPSMSIIKGFTSNAQEWIQILFPPFPEDLLIVRNLLRGEDSEPSMDELILYDIQVERERESYPKNKHIFVDGENNTAETMELPTDEWYRNNLNRQAIVSGNDQVNPPGSDALGNEFKTFFSLMGVNFDKLPTDNRLVVSEQFVKALQMCNGGLHIINEALTASSWEACTTTFRAEMAEKEVAHLKDEIVANSLCESEIASRQATGIRRTSREGKWKVVQVLKNSSVWFASKFGEFKKTYKSVGDYRECRGSVGILWRLQDPDYSYDVEMAKMSRHMRNHENADYVIS